MAESLRASAHAALIPRSRESERGRNRNGEWLKIDSGGAALSSTGTALHGMDGQVSA
jgi:hypothetical protein